MSATHLLPRLQAHLETAQRVGVARGVHDCLILAVLDRETLCGHSSLLDMPGPKGTGDFKPRLWARYKKRPDLQAHLKIWRATPAEMALHFPKVVLGKWEDTPQICMPLDGRGWGRGLGQIDFAAHTEWCLKKLEAGGFAWEDAEENIDKVAELLHAGIVAFDGDEWLAAVAYNAGVSNARDALLRLSSGASAEERHRAADAITTGHDYARDVITRRERFYRQLTHKMPTS